MRYRRSLVPALILLLLAGIALTGCGSDGSNGKSWGYLAGVLRNLYTGQPVNGATATLDPPVPGVVIITAADGSYLVKVPIGVYTVTFSAPNYEDLPLTGSVVAKLQTNVNGQMEPSFRVKVEIGGVPGAPVPGQSFLASAIVTVMDGSTILGYQWDQEAEAPANIASPAGVNTNVTLANNAAYKEALVEAREPESRWEVLGIDPLALEESSHLVLKLMVTTTSGVYPAEEEILANLPFAVWATGLHNVPTGLPVLLNGEEQSGYFWVMSTKPAGSAAVLQDGGTRFPWFVPDVPGLYEIKVGDETPNPSGDVTVQVFGATWRGVIVGQDANGRPVVDPFCFNCHDDGEGDSAKAAKDKPLDLPPPILNEENPFLQWPASGHAEIFSYNLDTSTHYSSEDCFACHTVGYSEAAANGGIDEASDYNAFLNSGLINHPGDNWTTVLDDYPNTAMKANVQCENCHGPQNSQAHVLVEPFSSRTSLKSEVCGYCHGEPPRHGRYQQWKESGHGNFELAIEEGEAGRCNRCHTAQGYLAWLENGLQSNPPDLPSPGYENWVQPITCAVCHDPHAVGTVSGDSTDAMMRPFPGYEEYEGPGRVVPVTTNGNGLLYYYPYGETPPLPSGYSATDVGSGAGCISCHNTRNGQHDDFNYYNMYGPPNEIDDRAPHVAAQGDVLLGFNAYFMDRREARGGHSFLEKTCVTCHMEATPPPAGFSYNQTGTNHTFEANFSICGDCHGDYDGGTLMDFVDRKLEELHEELSSSLNQLIGGVFFDSSMDLEITWVDDEGNEYTDTFNYNQDDYYGAELTEEFHGRMACRVNFNGTWYENVQLGKVYSYAYDADILHIWWGQTIARAAWNYYLLHADGSHGVHNPEWVIEVIENSIEALWEAGQQMETKR